MNSVQYANTVRRQNASSGSHAVRGSSAGPWEDGTTIDDSEALQRLKTLPGWGLEQASISRKFTFAGFADALAFVVRLGFDAEAVDHHPDILINYKRVTLTYTTHSEGGLTEKDFAGAVKASELAAAMGGQ